VTLWAAVLAALGASACGATANTLQHRTAVAVDGRPSVATLWATVRHRLWLVALVLQVVGFLLHALALRYGQLTVVQPLLVCAVLFALPLNRILRRERITRREIGWAALLVIGLAGFLVAEAPPTPGTPQPIDAGPAVLAGALGLVAVVVCALVSLRVGGRAGPAGLGIASGILFAGQAALLKSSVGLLARNPLALVTSWQVYALLVAGLGGVVFSQLAYRYGPLSASLPLVVTVNPVLGVLVGVFVYDESIRDSTMALVVEAVFLLVLVVATVVLTLLEQHAKAPSPEPQGCTR
jgi:drug/metabolite transporter (DMT)-like permease